MPNMTVNENDSLDNVLRHFRRLCERLGTVAEAKHRKYYEKPTSVRKRKLTSAVRRQQRKVVRERSRRTRLY